MCKKHDRNFTSKQMQYLSRMNKVSTRTVRNVLNKNEFAFRPTRRKGILLAKDLFKRLQFGKKVLKFNEPTFWTNGL